MKQTLMLKLPPIDFPAGDSRESSPRVSKQPVFKTFSDGCMRKHSVGQPFIGATNSPRLSVQESGSELKPHLQVQKAKSWSFAEIDEAVARNRYGNYSGMRTSQNSLISYPSNESVYNKAKRSSFLIPATPEIVVSDSGILSFKTDNSSANSNATTDQPETADSIDQSESSCSTDRSEATSRTNQSQSKKRFDNLQALTMSRIDLLNGSPKFQLSSVNSLKERWANSLKSWKSSSTINGQQERLDELRQKEEERVRVRQEIFDRQRRQRWRALWKKAIFEVVRRQEEKKMKTQEYWKSAVKNLQSKNFSKKSRKVLNKYEVLCDEMNRVMDNEWQKVHRRESTIETVLDEISEQFETQYKNELRAQAVRIPLSGCPKFFHH